MTEVEIVNSVMELYKQKDWKAIIETYRDHPERNKLLWVFPTEENFEFLTRCMEELMCDKIVSIGCGSGLLEWMITEATDYPVTGVEVDGAWWHCKYAPPTFIPLHVTTPNLDKETVTILKTSKTALLFCYFNNGPAFKQYLEHYSGKMLVIIGPGYGKGVHTDPKPFGNMPREWNLHSWQEVASTRDFIVVYCKKS